MFDFSIITCDIALANTGNIMIKSHSKLGLSVVAMVFVVLASSFAESGNLISGKKFATKFTSILATAQMKEFIIEVNEISDKNLSQVRNSIEGQGGFSFRGYCPSTKMLMYLVDRDMHPDDSFLNKLTALSFTFQVKEGASIAAVRSNCGLESVDPASETE